MNREPLDFSAIELKAYGAFHNDGLEDLAGGICVITYGMMILSEWFFLVGVVIITLQVLVAAARRKLSYPRLGYIRPSVSKRNELRLYLVMAMVVTLLLVLATTGVLLAVNSGILPVQPRSETGFRLGVALAALLGLVGMGALTGIKRWFLYAGSALICTVTMAMLGFDPLLGVAISGVPMLAVGLALIMRLMSGSAAGMAEHGQ